MARLSERTPLRVRDLWSGFSSIEGNLSHPPMIAVIFPVSGRVPSELLKKAVQSVLEQSFREFELVFVDDGSQSETAQYLSSMASKDERVSYFRFASSCGIRALAVNFGIMHSHAPVLAFMSQDDAWYPNAIEDLLKEISKPDRDVVHARVFSPFLWRGSSAIMRELWAPTGELPISHPGMLRCNMISNSAVALRKEVLSQVGMYDPHIIIRGLSDWDFWRRVTRQFSIFAVDSWIGEIAGTTGEYNPDIGAKSNRDIMEKYMMIERSHLLKPNVIDDFVINDCSLLSSNISAFDMPMIHEILRQYYGQVGRATHQKISEADMQDSLRIDPTTDPRSRILLSKQVFDAGARIYFLAYLEAQRGRKYCYRLAGELETQFSDLMGCDVLILVKTLSRRSVRVLEIAKRLGKRVIYFVDDNLLRITEDFGTQVGEWALNKELLDNFRLLVSRSDLVVVSTETLAAELATIARRIYVLPPNIPEYWINNFSRPPNRSGRLRIGHVGTGYRQQEFTMIAPALTRVAEELGEKVHFEFWGMDASKLMPESLPIAYREFTWDYENYLKNLCTAGFDILLTPLMNTPYRNCKSYIKYLETTAAGAAGIYSDTPVYDRIVKNEETGLLVANSADEWAAAILRLAENWELRETIIQKSREDVRRNNTTENTMETFNKMFEDSDLPRSPTLPGLLMRIGEVVDAASELQVLPTTTASVIGSFPGAKLVRVSMAILPIRTALVWADRVCEIGGRVLKSHGMSRQ